LAIVDLLFPKATDTRSQIRYYCERKALSEIVSNFAQAFPNLTIAQNNISLNLLKIALRYPWESIRASFFARYRRWHTLDLIRGPKKKRW
jgi:hypothetical protein